MLFKEISKILGNYLFYFSLVLCIPLSVAIYYQFVAEPAFHPQPHSSLEFLETIAICLFLALSFRFFGRKAKGKLYNKESILLVVLIWIVTSVISAFPFYLTKTLENPIDAYFEAMSGITTTGATLISSKKYDDKGKELSIYIDSPEKTYTYFGTVEAIQDPTTGKTLEGLEAVGRAILLWRSFLQWLGGMGIVVLFLTVLPALGVGGKFLYQTEVTGPVKESISPRIKETASLLWKLYIGLSFLEIILLLLTNETIPLFDAVCITFSNLSTGGFGVHPTSIASYQSAATEWIVIIFMVLGSINFGLYFHIIRLKFYRIYSPDFFLFMFSIFITSSLVSYFLIGTPTADPAGITGNYSVADAIRSGTFQAISAQTSTGFFTSNYVLWPFVSQMVMLLSMFFGGMAGATCGGLKSTRFYLLFKVLSHRVESMFRPETVRKLHFGNSEIDAKASGLLLAFFCVAGFFTVTGIAFFILTGIDPQTSLGLTACYINNIGIAFGAAGPLDAMNFLSPLAKLGASFFMLLGRLEFFAVLLLFFPGFWRRK